MKSVWSFFFLVSLFSKNYCSIESNVVSQPLSLSKSDLLSLANEQMKYFLSNEPPVAYNKLNDGTLEMFGTAFGSEVTSEKILFLQDLISKYDIHSVVLKWFHFDEKMLRIFDVFDEKLQKSVKSVTFDKCYFPEGLVFEGALELNYATDCSFIHCFANEETFKVVFKIFKNAPVTSLKISRVFNYKQYEAINTNIALKSMVIWNNSERSVKINDLELHSFFSSVKFLTLSSLLDFEHFSLTSLKNLDYVDLSDADIVKLCISKLFERLPTNVTRISVSFSYYYSNSSFIESAFNRKVIINTRFPFKYDEINDSKALSVFSSLHFKMDEITDKMNAIKEYVESNGGAINTVTSVKFYMAFNYQNITNMMTLLTYFPKLDSIVVWFINNCDASINDDQILKLFSTPFNGKVKRLSIYYEQVEDTSAFYCFIVELMKMCPNISSLEFHYSSSNYFAINIKKIVEGKDIQFSDLNTFAVEYCSANVDLSVDLFYVAKYNIKNLTMNINPLDSRKKPVECSNWSCPFEYFSVDKLIFYMRNSSAFRSLLSDFLTKCPHVTNFSWDSDFIGSISTSDLQKMKTLKNVIVKHIVRVDDFSKLLLQLPHYLESLEIECSTYEIEEIEKGYYEKFPTASLTMNAV